MIRPEREGVRIYELADLEQPSFEAPRWTIDLPPRRRLRRIYFHKGQPAIVRLRGKDSSLFRCRQVADNFTLQALPDPDTDRLIGVRWTTKGDVLVATGDLRRTRVYRLDEDLEWALIAQASETSGRLLDEPYFCVINGETPVVTWEATLDF